MDQARFQEAKNAYSAGDFRAAAKGFLAAAGRGTEGNGAAYHMAGNALLRLRRYNDAVTVFGHALRDELYDKRGAAMANLAAAHVALGEYAEAVERYRAALEEPDYHAQYKALQGLAGALLEMGRYEDAASAYRQAALDGDNPDSGKALNNLGLCFMAMGRPVDAIEAYKAALGFDTYTGKGRALANLGIAFAGLGQHSDAVKAFEKATQLHGHTLSANALEQFQASRDALAGKREIVEGWSTGEMPPVLEQGPAEDSGWDTGELESMSGVDQTTAVMLPVDPGKAASGAGVVEVPDDDGESAFFTRTDQEMKDHDKASRRAERDERRLHRNPWIPVFAALAMTLVVVGALAAAYFVGLGYPSQSMTVTGMMQARAEGKPVEGYWVAVPTADLDKEMAKLPPAKEYGIESVERSPRTSKVVITVTPDSGAPLSYEITLAREGVGWKVAGVENDWRSTGGGS